MTLKAEGFLLVFLIAALWAFMAWNENHRGNGAK